MHFFKSLLLICFFLHGYSLVAQTEFHIDEDYLLFEDAKTGEPILVYNDSMAARGFGFKEHFRVSFPDVLKPKYFTDYQYHIGDATYLVDNGGGIVLKFENNTFKRIDESFRHRSQFKGVPFVKDSTIYLYGGYGLFTFKNILTKYNFDKNEWDRVQMKNKNIIPSCSNTIYIKKDNELFVFAGLVENKDYIFKRDLTPNLVWCLNLDNLEWRVVGRHKLYSYFTNLEHFQKANVDTKLVLFKYNIDEIDIEKNTVNKYHYSNYKTYYKVIYHPKTKMVSYVYKNYEDKIISNSEPYKDFRGSLVSSTSFYQPVLDEFEHTSSLAVALLILGGGLFFFYKRKKGIIAKPLGKTLIYDAKSDIYSYKGKTIKDVSQYKKQLLKAFMKDNDKYILLSDLDTMLSELDNNGNNFAAIKKRRELLVKELKNELSLILGVDKDKIFSTRKNELDKRIKEIKLNIEIRKE